MAGSLPAGETSEASASTRCQAGLSSRALLLECTSLRGPRPQRSPLEVSSHSMTPFAPRNIDTSTSRPCEAKGMNTTLHFLTTAATWGLPAITGKAAYAYYLVLSHSIRGILGILCSSVLLF